MAEAKAEQEPSIEEILESIRQIISEDTEEETPAAEATAETAAEPAETAAPSPDLSLTPEAEAPVSPSDLSLTPETEAPVPPSDLSLTPEAEKPLPEAAEPLTLTPDIAEPVGSDAAPLDLNEKIEPPESPSSTAIEMMDIDMTDNDKEAPATNAGEKKANEEAKVADALMSPETANAVTDSLAKLLSSNVFIEDEGHDGKVTLEEIARNLMKPLIKIWLDQNLPAIIEKAVQKEVEKLSRRAMDR